MTLKDIAKELGVSPSTVSRVISGTGNNFTVKPELRQRILDYVRECGYRPNQAYQAMRKKDNQQIAIIMRSVWSNTQAFNITNGVDSLTLNLHRQGYTFHYLIRPMELYHSFGLPDWKVAGVIAVDAHTRESLQELNGSNIPYVVLNGVTGDNGSAVRANEEFNMNLALNHLFELGHRKIVFVNAYRPASLPRMPFHEHHYSVIDRAEAYFKFCKERGLFFQETADSCDYSEEEVVRQGVAAGATAYVTYGFNTYLTVCHYLTEFGLRVPEDVSVVCFNNDPLSEYSTPPATCIEIPVMQMRATAGELLLERIRNPKSKPRTEMFSGRLIIRKSTAPVRKNNKNKQR